LFNPKYDPQKDKTVKIKQIYKSELAARQLRSSQTDEREKEISM
jgi:hypothetical protein